MAGAQNKVPASSWPAGTTESKQKILREWVSSLEEAREKRQWGQILEVSQEYQRTARRIKIAIEEETNPFTKDEKSQLYAIQRKLYDYASILRKAPEQDRTSLIAMDSVIEDMHGLVSPTKPGSSCMVVGSEMAERVLIPAVADSMRIVVDRIGIKYADKLFQPFIRISVKDANGKEIESIHDTPYSSRTEHSYIIFNSIIDINTKLTNLPQGSAIFFELLHFKPSKRKVSTKCFAFMELDELKPGPAALEIYKKPTDFTKQKLELLTNRSLYLHVLLQFT